ncbi:MAG: desulforedoxin [Candidatus Portnoybacteria bacterium CG10_big_fil_rev_8_21_14_0_10_44_7]|uniref:Desulforedoxin n=1 Tax=Candidatus Portnoybacteria bacterium CG10_big_fil_rev_8_21_14_0_10_44_7 TaxID=1974816 RepID=A0A2M8KIC7_9BACT|nr:MAG: desulforedoxin [Candidatus Portnoybacteria bacterium CG10_big_fil_rev_8_21_14_0_10_44_7]
MPVKEIGEKYHCNVCGNEVVVTKVGGGTLVCCGEDMQLLPAQAKAETPAQEEPAEKLEI